jgi:hypothetical protein
VKRSYQTPNSCLIPVLTFPFIPETQLQRVHIYTDPHVLDVTTEEKTGSLRHTQLQLQFKKSFPSAFCVCLPCVYAKIVKPYMDV